MPARRNFGGGGKQVCLTPTPSSADARAFATLSHPTHVCRARGARERSRRRRRKVPPGSATVRALLDVPSTSRGGLDDADLGGPTRPTKAAPFKARQWRQPTPGCYGCRSRSVDCPTWTAEPTNRAQPQLHLSAMPAARQLGIWTPLRRPLCRSPT